MASTSGGRVNRALLKSRGHRGVISTEPPMYNRNITFERCTFFFFWVLYITSPHNHVTTVLLFFLLATLKTFGTTRRLSSKSKFQTSGRDNNFFSSSSPSSPASKVNYSCLSPPDLNILNNFLLSPYRTLIKSNHFFFGSPLTRISCICLLKRSHHYLVFQNVPERLDILSFSFTRLCPLLLNSLLHIHS